MSTVATTDDEALLRAVLADPADEAPRLVYADWLDKRGDPRGEYLRLDVELARSGKMADHLRPRVRRLRKQFPRPWVVAVSRGGTGNMCWLDSSYSSEPAEHRRWQRAPAPSWDEVESGFRELGSYPDGLVRLRFGSDLGRCDYFDAVKGPDAIGMGGRLENGLWHFHDPAGRPYFRHRIGFDEVEEDLLCFDLETVIQAAKWAYYYQPLAPDLNWIPVSEAFGEERMRKRITDGAGTDPNATT